MSCGNVRLLLVAKSPIDRLLGSCRLVTIISELPIWEWLHRSRRQVEPLLRMARFPWAVRAITSAHNLHFNQGIN